MKQQNQGQARSVPGSQAGGCWEVSQSKDQSEGVELVSICWPDCSGSQGQDQDQDQRAGWLNSDTGSCFYACLDAYVGRSEAFAVFYPQRYYQHNMSAFHSYLCWAEWRLSDPGCSCGVILLPGQPQKCSLNGHYSKWQVVVKGRHRFCHVDL